MNLFVHFQFLTRLVSEYILPILSSVYKSMLSTDRATTALEKANCQQKTRDKEIQSFLQSDDLSVLAVYARWYDFVCYIV